VVVDTECFWKYQFNFKDTARPPQAASAAGGNEEHEIPWDFFIVDGRIICTVLLS